MWQNRPPLISLTRSLTHSRTHSVLLSPLTHTLSGLTVVRWFTSSFWVRLLVGSVSFVRSFFVRCRSLADSREPNGTEQQHNDSARMARTFFNATALHATGRNNTLRQQRRVTRKYVVVDHDSESRVRTSITSLDNVCKLRHSIIQPPDCHSPS